MEPLIRDKNSQSESAHSQMPRLIRWVWFFAFLAISAMIAASWYGRSFGWPTFILLLGVSIVSILAILTVFFNRQTIPDNEPQDASIQASLLSSFHTQSTPSLIVKDGKSVLANRAYINLASELGVEASSDVPPSVERLFSKKEISASAAIFRLHHTNSGNDVGEENIRTLDGAGTYRSFKVTVSSIKDGQLWQIKDDIKSSVNGTALLAEAPVGLFSVASDGSVLNTNSVLQGWLGFDVDTAPGMMHEFIESPGALLDSPKISGRTVRSDTRLITQKGVVSPVVLMGGWHEMDSGDVYASVAVYGHSGLGAELGKSEKPIDSQVQIEKQTDDNDVVANAASLRNAPFGVVIMDSTDLKTAKILSANVAMAKMIGHDVEQDVLFKDLFVENPSTATFIASGINVHEGPVDVRLKSNAIRKITNGEQLDTQQNCPVDVYFSVPDASGCVAYIIDVTSRKALEDELGHSQKMQAIGQLAAGLAHEFNNLLTAIRLNADVLLGRHPIGDPSYPELQKINQTVSRATGLVRKLLAFSRKQTMRAVVLDVTDTLSDLTHLLQDVLVERVKLEVIHGRGLLPILADKGQLDTVLLNLCVNARDAMLEKGGGTITLKSDKVSDEDLAKQGIAKRKAGTYVRFDVSDTGTGMDKATRDKIFEPFFTTKTQGKGTGLGLATVYGIVQQSDGHLRVKSELGVGTTFSVYIPTAIGDVQIAPKPKPKIAEARVKPSDLSGQGNILFVEDEANVRVIAAKTLRKRGYTVIEAEHGEEAYEILKVGDETFDLMISDVVMPGMDGPTLLKQGRHLLGDARIVFISGYAEEEFSDLLAEEPDVTFLPKPFTLTQLAEKVKIVLSDDFEL